MFNYAELKTTLVTSFFNPEPQLPGGTARQNSGRAMAPITIGKGWEAIILS